MDPDMTYEYRFFLDSRAEYKLYQNIHDQLDPSSQVRRNKPDLQNYCYYGFVNDTLRSNYWKLFLGLLPENKFKTENFLKERRRCYRLYLESTNEMDDIESKQALIDDMTRVMVRPDSAGCGAKCKFLDAPAPDGTHRDAIKRLLLCFTATNSTIGYVQGMHMLAIPIYYVFATAKSAEDRAHAEADAYFCFHHLMVEVGEHFVKELDYDQNVGIRRKMDRVFEIIQRHDPDLGRLLADRKVGESCFHFRWIVLMLAHEFQIDQVVLLWDKFLADKNRFELVEYCCAAIVMLMKDLLVQADYGQTMELLQQPLDDALTIFFYADKLRRDDYALKKDKLKVKNKD